jgi:hypothetical protein
MGFGFGCLMIMLASVPLKNRPMEVQITDFIELATFRVFEDADVLQIKNDQKRQI